MPLILLTNDDGIYAEGLLRFYEKLKKVGDVVVVAPEAERSGVSNGITLHQPLRINKVKDGFYALSGTPTDCVILALNKVLPQKPDLVAAGINHGGNLGDDIIYSGTIGAAREASLHDIPAMAVSLVLSATGKNNFEAAAEFAAATARRLLEIGLPPGTFLNINIPPNGYKGVRITRQGNRFAENVISENQDPRGKKYYWIGQEKIHWEIDDPSSDYSAIASGFVSITPLQRDQTDYNTLRSLSEADFSYKTTKSVK